MPIYRVVDGSLQRIPYGGTRYYSPVAGGASYRSAQRAIWTLIGLNTLVFGAWTYARTENNMRLLATLHQNFTISGINWQAHRYWTLITSAFSHTMLPHFVFNMLSLNALATVLCLTPGIGGAHIFALGIGSAVVGSASWLYQSMHKPRASGIESALGASGLVMGIGAAAACVMPFAPMQLMFIPINIPLWAMTLLYVGVDTYFLNSARSSIGHSAHLGGAVFGALYYFAYLRRFGGVWQMLTKAGRGGRRR